MTSFLYALAVRRNGRFAPMVVLTVLGVLILFSSTPQASGTLAAPLLTSVQSPTAVQSPVDPGASASYTFTFVATSGLTNSVDDIVITFDNEFGVPSVIATVQITISADNVTGGGTPNEVVNPASVSVAFVGVGNDQPEVTLRVPDMDTSGGSGSNGIASGALVTVTLNQGAGLTNPTEGGSDPINIRTTQDTTDVEALNPTTNARVFTPTIIELSSNSESRGVVVTALAKGVEGEESATFFLDSDGDGVRDIAERDLCTVVANSNDTATCVFTVSNPPLISGTGDDCSLPVLANCNFINIVDTENRNTTGSLSLTLDQNAVDRQTFELEPTVILSPSQAGIGDVIVIFLFDYPPNVPISRIEIAGLDVTPGGLPSISSSGELAFAFVVPGVALNSAIIPTGPQPLEVFAGGASQDITLTIDEVTCVIPGSGDWMVSASCTFLGSATAPANVIVEPGIALTIATGAALDINFTNFHLLIKSGAKVVIRDGGKIS